MATLILRPVADVQLNHSKSSGSNGYSLISEATADGESSYIYYEIAKNKTGSATSVFKVSGSSSNKIRISSLRLNINAKVNNDFDSASLAYNLYFNGVEGASGSNDLSKSFANYGKTYSAADFGFADTIFDSFDAANLQVHILTSLDADKNNALRAYVTQMYLEVTYDEVSTTYTCSAIAGENVASASASKTIVTPGETVTFTATLNPGCSFDGWYTAASGGTKVSGNEIYTTTINASTTLYAKAIKNTYTIAVGVTHNGSASVNRSTAQYGDEVVFAATPDEYYDFLGWYDNSSFSGTPITSNPYRTTTITANTVLYAKFVHKTVTFGIDHPDTSTGNVNWVNDLYVVVLDKSAMNDALWEALWSNNWDVVRGSNACLNHKENHVDAVGPLSGSLSKQHINAFDVPMGAFVAFTGTFKQTSTTYSAFGMGQARFGYHKGLMPASTQYGVTSIMRIGASFGNMPPSVWPDGLPPRKGDIAYIDGIMSNTMVYHFVGYNHVNIIESNRPTGETYQIKPAPHASRPPDQLELFSTSVDEVTFEVGTTDSRWKFEGFYSDSNYTNLLTRNNPAVLPTYNNIYTETSPIVIDNVTITNSTSDKHVFKVYAKFTTEYPTTKATAVAKEGISSASVNNIYSVIVGDPVEYSCQVAEHYVFDGWYSDEECTELVSDVESFTYTTTQANVETLYAKATPIVYTITLEQADYGLAVATPSMGTYGTNSTLRWEDSLGWYDFNYWAKLENVQWVEISNTNPYDYVIKDNTLIKPFISEKPWYHCTVGGEYTSLISISAVQGHVVAGDEVTFSYNGNPEYTFLGWYSDGECTQLISEDTSYTFTPSSDVVLYAKIKQVSASTGIYLKRNGEYITVKAVYTKENGSWVEQTNYDSIFDPNGKYKIR